MSPTKEQQRSERDTCDYPHTYSGKRKQWWMVARPMRYKAECMHVQNANEQKSAWKRRFSSSRKTTLSRSQHTRRLKKIQQHGNLPTRLMWQLTLRPRITHHRLCVRIYDQPAFWIWIWVLYCCPIKFEKWNYKPIKSLETNLSTVPAYFFWNRMAVARLASS